MIWRLALVALVGCSPSDNATTEPTQSEALAPNDSASFSMVELSPEQGRLGALLAEHAELAHRSGLKPFVQVYADWCGPCVRLRDAMPDPRMRRAFEGTYIILLNADLWKTALEASELSNAQIPRFHELRRDGVVTGRFVTGGAWEEDTIENMAPILHRYFRDERREE